MHRSPKPVYVKRMHFFLCNHHPSLSGQLRRLDDESVDLASLQQRGYIPYRISHVPYSIFRAACPESRVPSPLSNPIPLPWPNNVHPPGRGETTVLGFIVIIIVVVGLLCFGFGFLGCSRESVEMLVLCHFYCSLWLAFFLAVLLPLELRQRDAAHCPCHPAKLQFLISLFRGPPGVPFSFSWAALSFDWSTVRWPEGRLIGLKGWGRRMGTWALPFGVMQHFGGRCILFSEPFCSSRQIATFFCSRLSIFQLQSFFTLLCPGEATLSDKGIWILVERNHWNICKSSTVKNGNKKLNLT